MKPQIENCQHQYAPLGMERISTDNRQIEVIVCVFCIKCSTFRILQYIITTGGYT
ncbi:MAG: hypothetical protein UT24_C0029G0025 [Candidatus Woesebacteria bacterium GW2011_GWB1_39_12]|uniref:Uncharacterized protein n=1 Tax=Candidatus Woesebacteria bacterium GW2011_GWB1_39_12 TaxID=1618574 RepID=A0A0G0M496_9BACT|nr:MAG: hypothetical protein UT24_C0029G0025 [Candidatus Woesebacteria bacterium GW2011_GWB1_39_12]